MSTKNFTKTLFKKSLSCPTSIYYYDKGDEYINNEIGNDFIKSLMEGGYQVEFLAKDYYPTGINLKNLSKENNIQKTKELIKNNENIILFEPLFEINGFLVRVDILEKIGNTLKLIEIKAKGFDFKSGNSTFINSKTIKSGNPQLKKDWEEYILDVAFQKYVLSLVYPSMYIESYLYMLDKNSKTSVDGIHQKYLVKENYDVEILHGSIGEPIMDILQIDEVFELVNLFNDEFKNFDGLSFVDYINYIKEQYLNGNKINYPIGSQCKNCSFYTTEETDTKKSGFLTCWCEQTGLTKEDIKNNSTVLDIWNFRGKDQLINNKIYLIKDIDTKIYQTLNINGDIKGDGIFETTNRQGIQVKKVLDNDKSISVFDQSLKEEMKSWIYPLNMIDFETTTAAIPFNIHLKPYESIAYQFSHHVIYEDGTVEHMSQYLHSNRGTFPSFDFIRHLKKSLESNNGSIFMYSPHENSILNHILRQLYSPLGDLENDKEDLINFIKSITVSNSRTISELCYDKDVTPWIGNRSLIDMWDILKKYYYNPLTNGSNSIKYVLPAILKSSDYLRNKYSKPIYGTDKIKSLNFQNHIWLHTDENGNTINPYKMLPPLFKDVDDDSGFITGERLANGGDAMVAYAKLQYTQMNDVEREAVMNGLLKYCELDTMAMVMIWEHWNYDILKK